jgi:PAS domain S-box-containing protein
MSRRADPRALPLEAAVIAGAPEPILSFDASGRVVAANAASEQVFGCPGATLAGRKIGSLFFEDALREDLAADLRRYLETGESEFVGRYLELKAQRPDGALVDTEIVIVALPHDPPLFTAYLRDLSRRRQQRPFGRSRERLRRALEASGLALFEVNVATGAVVLSEGWARMLGEPPVETRTTVADLLGLVHPDERELVRRAAADAMNGNASGYEVEHRVRARSGAWIWILSRGNVSDRDANGRAIRISGTSVDITERMNAAESEAKFQALWETSNDAIVLIDEERIIRYANPAVKGILGWEPAELTGRGIEALQPLDRRSTHRGGFDLSFALPAREALEGARWKRAPSAATAVKSPSRSPSRSCACRAARCSRPSSATSRRAPRNGTCVPGSAGCSKSCPRKPPSKPRSRRSSR